VAVGPIPPGQHASFHLLEDDGMVDDSESAEETLRLKTPNPPGWGTIKSTIS
jgi:hypothetical protein